MNDVIESLFVVFIAALVAGALGVVVMLYAAWTQWGWPVIGILAVVLVAFTVGLKIQNGL